MTRLLTYKVRSAIAQCWLTGAAFLAAGVAVPAPTAAGSAATPNLGPVPGLPSPPAVSDLESRRPKCLAYKITRTDKHIMEQCAAAWEEFRRVHIEGYRKSLEPFVEDLKRLDRAFQRQVPSKLSSDDYEEYRRVIAREIRYATDGRYLVIYQEYITTYREQVELLRIHHKQASG
jgi:hypothetical protein